MVTGPFPLFFLGYLWYFVVAVAVDVEFVVIEIVEWGESNKHIINIDTSTITTGGNS